MGRFATNRLALRPSGADAPTHAAGTIHLAPREQPPPGEHGGPWIDQLFTNTLDPAEHPYFAEIAPERKTDLGESFDWERLRRLLKNP